VLGRILVAYDDSAPARRALEEAVRLAQSEGASLIVVAVRDRLPPWDGASVGEVRAEHERRQDACYLWLWAAEAYITARGLTVRTEIRAGNLVRQLAAAADAHQADLLVVGRTQRPGPRARIFGSKAERLCRRLSRPILIVSAAG